MPCEEYEPCLSRLSRTPFSHAFLAYKKEEGSLAAYLPGKSPFYHPGEKVLSDSAGEAYAVGLWRKKCHCRRALPRRILDFGGG
jgi:hypothetical protein